MHDPEDDRRPFDLRAAVGFAIAMVEHEIEPKAELTLDAPEAAWVDGVDAQLVLLFIHLIDEALLEIPRGRARRAVLDWRLRRDRSEAAVELRTSERSQAVSPGLKLSLPGRIASAHGGRLELVSGDTADQGWMVRVVLPLAAGARTEQRL